MAPQPWEGGLQPAPSQGKPISYGADQNAGNADICPIQVNPQCWGFVNLKELCRPAVALTYNIFIAAKVSLYSKLDCQSKEG